MDKIIIKTKEFEGPLEILLQSLLDKKLPINKFSLAEVTQDYLEKVKEMSPFPSHSVSSFVLILSTLLLIKTKELIPLFTLTDEEEEDANALVDRLKVYELIQRNGKVLRNGFAKKVLHCRDKSIDLGIVKFSPGKNLSSDVIHLSIKSLIDRAGEDKVVNDKPLAVIKATVTLSDMMNDLTNRVFANGGEVSFTQFAKEKGKNKYDSIVSFLAVLELVKQGVLMVNQDLPFCDIRISQYTKIQ